MGIRRVRPNDPNKRHEGALTLSFSLCPIRGFGHSKLTVNLQWSYTEPEQGVFNFTEGEIVASKAFKADYYLRCHTLLWNLQLSEWVEAQEWTPAALREVVVNHITNVVGHWKGRCYSWDVVNEAFNEDGTFKETIWYNTLGEDYIKLAFQTAAKVDPKVKLYLNDYTFESPSPKTEAAQRLVKKLKAAGVRIDGVGLQSHLFAESHPTLDQHIDAIKGFTSLGVEVALTELDVSLEMPANAANLAQQREAYKNVRKRSSFRGFPVLTALLPARLSVLACRSRAASVLPSGISTTLLAGYLTSCQPGAQLTCGLRTSPIIPLTTVSSRP